jgi:hypothetical protein
MRCWTPVALKNLSPCKAARFARRNTDPFQSSHPWSNLTVENLTNTIIDVGTHTAIVNLHAFFTTGGQLGLAKGA